MQNSANPLDGATVVITGASSGIGLATARVLGDEGANVVLAARRNDRIEDAAEHIRRTGGRALAVRADVTVLSDMEALVACARSEFGTVDALVSNAGVARLGKLADGAVDDWASMIDVNVRGLLHAIAAVMPVFTEQGHGHVVSTVSTAGLKVTPAMGVYAATKNAARTIMEALRVESTDGVVRTTEISPGFVRTELADGMDDVARGEVQAGMAAYGLTPDAIAQAVSFALSRPRDVEIGSIVVRPTVQD